MKQQAGQVMSPRIHPPELNIQHVGQPCYGVPIAHLNAGKGPGYVFRGDSGQYMGVHGYIVCVIISNKIESPHVPISQ